MAMKSAEELGKELAVLCAFDPDGAACIRACIAAIQDAREAGAQWIEDNARDYEDGLIRPSDVRKVAP